MGCDIHLFMERRLNGRWVPVNPPPYEGEVDYAKEYPWGAWMEPPNPVEELAQQALPFEERYPSVAHQWAFGRNYDSFARLSGVRGDGAYREPNDIPWDVCESIYQQWGGTDEGDVDWHTPTHWTLRDLGAAHAEREHDGGYGVKRISALLEEMRRICQEYNLEPDHVRVVFWYDN